MKIDFQNPCLVIDTSSNLTSISVHYKDQFNIINEDCDKNITKRLLPNIDKLLKKTNLKIKNIECIIYSKGPGSFTSLRIGLSIAKGLSLPFNIPLIGIPKLDVMAFKAKYLNIKDNLILSYIINSRNEIFYAIYKAKSFTLKKKYTISKIDDFLKINLNDIFSIGNVKLQHNILKNKNIIFNPQATDYFNLAKENYHSPTNCEKANLLYINNKIALTTKEQKLYNENKVSK